MKTFTINWYMVVAKITIARIGKVLGVPLGLPGKSPYVRIRDGEFPDNMSACFSASFYHTPGGLSILTRPNGQDNGQGMVLFNPGPGRWTSNKKSDAPCPMRGKPIQGYRCKGCKTANPALPQGRKEPIGIHPDSGVLKEHVWADWQATEDAEMLGEFVTPNRATRLLALKEGAAIRFEPAAGDPRLMAFLSGQLLWGKEEDVRKILAFSTQQAAAAAA